MVGSKLLLWLFAFFLSLVGFYLTSSAREFLQKFIATLYSSLLQKLFFLQVKLILRVSPLCIRPSLYVASSDNDAAIGFALFFTLYALFCLCLSGFTVIMFSIKNIFFFDTEIKKIFLNANKLPLLNRVFLLVFTLSFSIPNKVWVKSGNSKYGLLRVIPMFFLLICAHVLPILYGVVWYMLCLVAESYIFARAYESYPRFKKCVVTYLFSEDEKLAAQYFSYFWGNMFNGALKAVKHGSFSAIPYAVYRYKRSDELQIRHYKTESEYNALYGKAQLHPYEQLELRRAIREKVQREDCPVLNCETACLSKLKVGAKLVQAQVEKYIE